MMYGLQHITNTKEKHLLLKERRCTRKLTKYNHKCHFHSLNFCSGDDASGASPPAIVVFVELPGSAISIIVT